MTNQFSKALGSNSNYLERPPERLVVEGYRQWTAGFDTGSIHPWELTWQMYCEELGTKDGNIAVAELSNFVRTLKRCATCPLRSFPFNSSHLCVEECLTLGLISDLQHDIDAKSLCLDLLTCPIKRDEVEGAAAGFASALKCFGHILLPVPTPVIEDVLHRSSKPTMH